MTNSPKLAAQPLLSSEELQKRLERRYLKSAIAMLGKPWTVLEERESPDFVIDEAGYRFGLEVTIIFTGPIENGGSVMMNAESKHHASIRSLQLEYEARHTEPLTVKLVGDISPANLTKVLPAIEMLELRLKPIGHHEELEIDEEYAEGMLRVHVTYALRSEWYYVDDRAGFVNKQPAWIIADRIANKARKLRRYEESTGLRDIRLLIVADRIMNSGKLILDGPVPFEPDGFTTVYFLSYPESIQVVETSVMKLSLEEQLIAAAQTAVSARAFYEIWLLYKGDQTRPGIIETMRRFNEFFRADHRAQLYALILHLSALLDQDSRSASIVNLLRLSNDAKGDMAKLAQAQALYDANRDLGRRVLMLRNKVFAHLSSEIKEQEAFKIAGITPDDLGRLAADCICICNKLLAANGFKEVFANRQVLPTTEQLFEALKMSPEEN